MIRVVVSGAGGRMGKLLLRAVIGEKDMELVGALEKGGHPLINRDAGDITGSGKCDILIGDNLEEVISRGDILVEFSAPEATLSHLSIALEGGNGVVIGTTGLSGKEKEKVKTFSSKLPIVLSPNMSIGVNLLFKVAGEVAKTLGTEYDVEIVETHHRLKKDAPSGTALRLAQSIAQARGQDLKKVGVYGRQGRTGERPKGVIGVHAVRGGTVTGEHNVIFAGPSEMIELSHRAESREVFVQGAIRAIRFAARAKPGLYDMQNVISSGQ